jgi:hypothetical protein
MVSATAACFGVGTKDQKEQQGRDTDRGEGPETAHGHPPRVPGRQVLLPLFTEFTALTRIVQFFS